MKHILATTFLTAAMLVATAFVAQADDRNIPEKIRDAAHETKAVIVGTANHAGKVTRAAWFKTKAYLGEDMPVYREGAHATLAGLAMEIAELKRQTPADSPAYFRTRILSLDQQHDYLSKRLALLSHEELRERSAGSRYDFDRCVADLEQAVDQAANGASMFKMIAGK